MHRFQLSIDCRSHKSIKSTSECITDGTSSLQIIHITAPQPIILQSRLCPTATTTSKFQERGSLRRPLHQFLRKRRSRQNSQAYKSYNNFINLPNFFHSLRNSLANPSTNATRRPVNQHRLLFHFLPRGIIEMFSLRQFISVDRSHALFFIKS